MVEAGITPVVGRSCGDSHHGPSSRSFLLTLLNEALEGLMAGRVTAEPPGVAGALGHGGGLPILSLRVLAPSLWGMCIKEDC